VTQSLILSSEKLGFNICFFKWVNLCRYKLGMTERERAKQELRLAHRITESAVSHFKGGRAMWAKAGGTLQAAAGLYRLNSVYQYVA
jgi:hypothetical protein